MDAVCSVVHVYILWVDVFENILLIGQVMKNVGYEH